MSGINDYPNAGNYPPIAFPQSIPPPDIDPDEGDLIYVGYNPLWQPYLMGALWAGLYPSTWEGTDEEKILALNRAENFRFLLTEPVALDDEAPTPYWDDADGTDADDQAPADEQDWYGVYDGDFTAQLTDWVLAGFIAYSGNIGAAIAFTTIAPRFRLAWKTGSLGGIIRVIIDAADVGTVDTYSEEPGVLEKDFIGDPEEESHSILMFLESVP